MKHTFEIKIEVYEEFQGLVDLLESIETGERWKIDDNVLKKLVKYYESFMVKIFNYHGRLLWVFYAWLTR